MFLEMSNKGVNKIPSEFTYWGQLPPYALDNLLSNWLNARDLVSLDTAATNYKLRTMLFQIFEDMPCIAFSQFLFTSLPQLRWVMRRSLDVRGFRVRLRETPSDMPSFHWLCVMPHYMEAEFVGSRGDFLRRVVPLQDFH